MVVASDALTTTAVLVDAARIAAFGDIITLDASTQATLELNSTPTGVAATSLWQNNLRGLKCERFFGVRPIGSSVSAVISGVGAWLA